MTLALPSFAARASELALQLRAVSLALPGVAWAGYDARQRRFGSRLNTGGGWAQSAYGRGQSFTGAASGGGINFSLGNTSANNPGPAPGYTIIAVASCLGSGESGLGRVAGLTGFNLYPEGAANLTWSGVFDGGSSHTRTFFGVWPYDGAVRTLGISYMPGTSGENRAPIFLIDGVERAGTQAEWPSGAYSGFTGPLTVGNASNNARCFHGSIYLVGLFARAMPLPMLRTICANPSILFA
jgi:hypothetical protein